MVTISIWKKIILTSVYYKTGNISSIFSVLYVEKRNHFVKHWKKIGNFLNYLKKGYKFPQVMHRIVSKIRQKTYSLAREKFPVTYKKATFISVSFWLVIENINRRHVIFFFFIKKKIGTILVLSDSRRWIQNLIFLICLPSRKSASLTKFFFRYNKIHIFWLFGRYPVYCLLDGDFF